MHQAAGAANINIQTCWEVALLGSWRFCQENGNAKGFSLLREFARPSSRGQQELLKTLNQRTQNWSQESKAMEHLKRSQAGAGEEQCAGSLGSYK